MQEHANSVIVTPKRIPWNKGKLVGTKPPLRPKHVWSIRTKLQVQGRKRDLALFNLAIDSGQNLFSLHTSAFGSYHRQRT